MKKIFEDGAIGGGPTNSVSGVAGIGAQSKDPAAPKNFAEPGVHKKKKKEVVKATLKRFSEWLEEDKHEVRGVTGKMVDVKKAPVRHPGGKMTMEYPGKSSSSGGGE